MTVDPDSRARTHLANERTFLAWFRTGLTLVAFGVVAGQVLTGDDPSGDAIVRGLSTIVIATGAMLVIVGVYRYLEGRSRIDAGEFHPADRSIIIAAVAAIATAILALLFIWFVPLG